MGKRLLTLCQVTLLIGLAASSQERKQEGSQQARTLKVQVNYTGAGTVDKAHKIFVVLWDSPDFVQGNAMPISLKPVTANNEIVTFDDVQKVPAYVSAAYDPSGGWDGESGPPPAGTSLGLYGKEGPEAIDIPPGKTVTIKVTFDDTIKMK